MTGIRIRDARSFDREAIGTLWRELMAYHLTLDPRFVTAPDGERRYVRHAQDMMRSRDARVLIAELGERGPVVGYLLAELQQRPQIALPGTYGFVSDMYVAEAWRRHGVGRALFSEARRWFLARKATAIELYVAERNPESAAFWEAMGFASFLKLLHQDLY